MSRRFAILLLLVGGSALLVPSQTRANSGRPEVEATLPLFEGARP